MAMAGASTAECAISTDPLILSPDKTSGNPISKDEGDTDEYRFHPPAISSRVQNGVGMAGRRNTISCNTCRRRKIKCDRANPCSQCRTSFHDCDYSERSRRKIKNALSLERMGRLEKMLKPMDPSVPVGAASAAAPISTPVIVESLPPRKRPTQENLPIIDERTEKAGLAEFGKCATAYYSIEQGEMEFQGYSAERTFLQGMKEKLGDWPGNEVPRGVPAGIPVPGFFSTDCESSDEVSLPARHQALKLVEAALDAQILLYVIHRPTFDFSFNLIYSLEPSEYGTREKRFLPLLYAVLSYGSLFVEPISEELSHEEAISKALRYYSKSRQLQDIAYCKDLVSLQAVVFLNLFLLSTCRISTCYTYLSASLSIALRMGLHRSLNTTQDMISSEIGKRIFWTLRFLFNDVSAAAGLPRLLSDDEIDQEFPSEVNDIYIQRGGILRQPKEEICYVSGANAYKRLHMILDRVIKQVYPPEASNGAHPRGTMSYAVKLGTIRSIEEDMNKWSNNIPYGYRLGTYHADSGLRRAQFMLYILYAHIQLCLYRPFLLNVIDVPDQPNCRGEGFSSCATACIQVCKNAVSLFEDMAKRGLLSGADWPTTRTLFSCILTLLYTILISRGSCELESLFKSLATARKILNHFAKRSIHSRRFKVMLAIMISGLPKSFDEVRERLFNFDNEVDEVFQCGIFKDGRNPFNDSYTAFLGEKALSVSSKPDVKGSGVNPTKDGGIPKGDSEINLQISLQKQAHNVDTIPNQLPSQVAVDPSIPCPSNNNNPLDASGLPSQSSPTKFPIPSSLVPSIPAADDETLEARPLDFFQGISTDTENNGIEMGDSREPGLYDDPMTDFLGSVGLYLRDPQDLMDFQSWF